MLLLSFLVLWTESLSFILLEDTSNFQLWWKNLELVIHVWRIFKVLEQVTNPSTFTAQHRKNRVCCIYGWSLKEVLEKSSLICEHLASCWYEKLHHFHVFTASALARWRPTVLYSNSLPGQYNNLWGSLILAKADSCLTASSPVLISKGFWTLD